MNAQSIRKIRQNFIIISMLSFMTVMLFTGGLINIVNNLRIRDNVSNMLDYIIEHEGDLPVPSAQSPESSSSFLGSGPVLFTATPEFLYTTRYYAVIFDKYNHVDDVKLNHIYSVQGHQIHS